MAAGDDAPSGPDYAAGSFAGDLFLSLAADGRLSVDPDRADRVITGLEETIEVVRARLRILELWRGLPAPGVRELSPAEQPVVDAVFADQIAPGQLEQA